MDKNSVLIGSHLVNKKLKPSNVANYLNKLFIIFNNTNKFYLIDLIR